MPPLEEVPLTDPSLSPITFKTMTQAPSPRIQAHTFIRWMNNKLVKAQKPLIRSLVRDLQNAVPLMTLVEVCTEQDMPFTYHEECDTEEKRWENWRMFIGFLVDEGVVDKEVQENCKWEVLGRILIVNGRVLGLN